jgi:hypothetical protein
MSRLLLRAAAGIFVAVVAAGIYLNYFGPVDSTTLSHSVASAESVGSLPPFYASCLRRSNEVWSCQSVTEEQSDTGGTYLVHLSGRCWTARETSAAGSGLHLPRHISGCVGIFDQLRISDRLGLGLAPPPGSD